MGYTGSFAAYSFAAYSFVDLHYSSVWFIEIMISSEFCESGLALTLFICLLYSTNHSCLYSGPVIEHCQMCLQRRLVANAV